MSYNGALFPVVEILVRLSSISPGIGEYIFHTYSGSSHEVVVITTTGKIIIPVLLLTAQEDGQELIDDLTLRILALSLH